jgi:small-conductance mechanosensitive channel
VLAAAVSTIVLPFAVPPAGSAAPAPPAPSPPSTPCAAAPGMWCEIFYGLTHTGWLAQAAEAVIAPALAIVVIVAVAVLLRWLTHRLVDRMSTDFAEGRVPTLLRPLADRTRRRPRHGAAVARRAQRARTLGSLLKSVASFVIYGVACVLVLSKVGIDIAPIIASVGVVGIAVGFGAQNLVKDFLSGIFMMLEDQYGVGDVVDLGAATGTVESMGLRITRVRDLAGTVWYVRNGTITAVGNSTQHFAVAVVDIPIAYGADIDRATEIAESTARRALARPPLEDDVLGEVEMLGAQTVTRDAVTLRLTVTTKPGQQWAVRRALTAEILDALDEAGVPAPLAGLLAAFPGGREGVRAAGGDQNGQAGTP